MQGTQASGAVATRDGDAASLLGRAMDALAHCDRKELDLCLDEAMELPPLLGGPDLRLAITLHRRLGALLQETRRNLRLMRRAAGVSEEGQYGEIYRTVHK